MRVTGSPSLNAARRARELDMLAHGRQVDVLVVGGGITGAGVALDAATRGLSVALVERRDLANGTSRWSSKLAHGGLRYLRQGEVGVAWESARERHVLMTLTAPHLVRALPFVAPLNGAMRGLHGALTETGIRVGDLMRMASGTPTATLPGPRRISRHEALRLVPELRPHDLRGALLFWDGQIEDDARLVIAVARTAAAHGAMVLTYCEATQLRHDGATVRDVIGGQSFTVRAGHVVNAAGVWAGALSPGVKLTPSKGSHVILAAATLGNPRAALAVPVPHASARWVGATPAEDGRVIVGVTDEPYARDAGDEPRASADEEGFLLDVLSLALRTPVQVSSVIGSYAGLRPLLAGKHGATADLSRRHAIIEDRSSGVVTVVGGKLTTYRRMAEDTIDRILRGSPRPCRTHRIPLVGAASAQRLRAIDAPQRLVRRYGTEAPAVAALAGSDASLLQPIAPTVPVLGVELLFGLGHEGALTVSDLIDRRVRLGLVPAERRAAEPAAAMLLQRAAA